VLRPDVKQLLQKIGKTTTCHRIGKAVTTGSMADQLPHSSEKRSSAEVERPPTSGSASTGSSSSFEYDPQVHRLQSRNTELDLERHRTGVSRALSRTETQRTQHALTVGESLRSRQSTAPLPAFGAGKPYPPPLPAREEYVVEFDGPDDPLYPLNWPVMRK
jgi:DHA1 family multidrug resistance protein-like MFS transporter